MTFKERWEIFRVKYFPKVQVSNDEYYKNPFSRYTYILTTHSMFKYTTILLTTLNIVVIALNRYPLDQSQEDFIGSFLFRSNLIIFQFRQIMCSQFYL